MIESKRLLPALLIGLICACIGQADTENETDLPVIVLEDFIVTGSHFTSDELIIDLPLTRIDDEALHLWADTSAYTALLDQPFAYGYANSDTQSNGLTGSAGANLRGLGNLNTLTLINGRRAGGNSAVGFEHGGFADLNLIPVAAIREVQVAVDGTSVIYGSDAVAGTVNLLLHDDYVGNRVDTSYSNTTNGDAAEKRLSFLTGQELNERTHLVLAGSWYERNAIYARDRNISKNANFTKQGGTDQRSGTFPGRIQVDGTAYALDGISAPDVGAPFLDNYTADFEGFNFNDFAPAIPELEQRSAMAHLSYDLTDRIELWSELLYTKTEFENGLAPAPWTANSTVLSESQTSPHLPNLDGGTLTGLSYRNFALGNLNGLYEKEASRLLLGLRGEVREWDWEAAVMQIQSNLDVEWSGMVDTDKLADSITDGSFNPFATAYATGNTGGTLYDNPAALRAAATTAKESFDEQYRSIDFKTGGPILELPAGEILALLGTEYRKEEVGVGIDPSIQFTAPTALGRTSGYSPYDAERSVFSFFAEAMVPVFGEPSGDEPHSLDLQLAVRYDDYTDKSGGLTNTYNDLVYKVGIDYKPTRSLSLKASFSTAFRAPTLNESFSNGFVSLIYNDPTGDTPPFQRVETLLGANPDLEPERSQILNLGIYYEPEFAKGLKASVNYYRIETKDAITNNGQDLVDSETDILRDGSGALFLVFANRFNAAEVIIDGLEYEIAYFHQNSNSQWEASLGVNQVLRYDVRPSDGASEIDFLGRLSHPLVPSESVQGPGSIPEFKGYARLVWTSGGLTLGGTVNYIHSLDDNPAATDDGGPRKIDAWTSLDLVAQYRWLTNGKSWFSGTSLTLGIENVTDEEPPFAAGAFADGYDSSLYNLEGRRVSLSLSKEF